MTPLLDTDVIRVNRAGVDYQATWAEVKAGVPGGPPPDYVWQDADAEDYGNRVAAADGSMELEDAVKAAIDQLFLDLKAITNVWGSIGAFYPLSGARTIDGALLTAYPKSVPDLTLQSVTGGDYDRLGVYGDRVSKGLRIMVDGDWRSGTSPWLGIRTVPGIVGDEAGVKIGAIKDGSHFWLNNSSISSEGIVRYKSTGATSTTLDGKSTQTVLGGATQTTGNDNTRLASASIDVDCNQATFILPSGTSNLGIMCRINEGAYNAFSGSKHSCVIYLTNYPGDMARVRSICQAFDTYHASINAALSP